MAEPWRIGEEMPSKIFMGITAGGDAGTPMQPEPWRIGAGPLGPTELPGASAWEALRASYPGDVLSGFFDELYNTVAGIGGLATAGSANLLFQPLRLFPEERPMPSDWRIGGVAPEAPPTLREEMIGSATEQLMQQVEGLMGAPETIKQDIARSWTAPVETFRHEPITAMTSWALPFSVASGGAGLVAKGAGILGKGATAAKLGAAADIIAPSGILNLGYQGLRQTPGVGRAIRGEEAARGAQRIVVRNKLGAIEQAGREFREFALSFDQLPDVEKAQLSKILEGTLDDAALAAPSLELKNFLGVYRSLNATDQARLLDELSDPVKKMERALQFEETRFQPLRTKTGLTTQEIKDALAGQGIPNPAGGPNNFLAYADKQPTYYPHRGFAKFTPEQARDFYGALQRTIPGFRKPRKGAAGYSEDVYQVMAAHRMAINQYFANEKSLQEILGKWGYSTNRDDLLLDKASLESATGMPHTIVAPDGYFHFFRKVIDTEERVAKELSKTGNLDQAFLETLIGLEIPSEEFLSVAKNQKLYLIPKNVYDRVKSQFQSPHPAVKLFFDQPTDIWRAAVLPLSPRWMAGNIVGSAGLATLGGVNIFTDYKWATKLKDLDAIPPEVRIGLHSEAMEMAAKGAGKTKDVSFIGIPVGKWAAKAEELYPIEVTQRIVGFGYRLNASADNFFREAVFSKEVTKAAKRSLREEGIGGIFLDPALITERAVEIARDPVRSRSAIQFTAEWLGNYIELTPFERNVVRRAFPFWSWYKAMGQLLIKMPVKYPGRNEALLMLADVHRDSRDPNLPLYLNESVTVGTYEAPVMHRFPEAGTMPQELRFSAGPLNPFGQFKTGLAPGMHPLVQALTNAIVGTDPSGNPLLPEEMVKQRGTVFAPGKEPFTVQEVTGMEKGAKHLQMLGKELIRSFPQVSLAEQVTTGVRARPQDPLFQRGTPGPLVPSTTGQDPWMALLQYFTGLRFSTLNKGRAMQRYMEGQKESLEDIMMKEYSKQLLPGKK